MVHPTNEFPAGQQCPGLVQLALHSNLCIHGCTILQNNIFKIAVHLNKKALWMAEASLRILNLHGQLYRELECGIRYVNVLHRFSFRRVCRLFVGREALKYKGGVFIYQISAVFHQQRTNK